MKMRDLLRGILPPLILAVSGLTLVVIGVGIVTSHWQPTDLIVIVLLNVVVVTMVASAVMEYMARVALPIAYNVAIIGYPRSGKTTLITSIFGELFARRILGVDSRPVGQTTIERVNADLAKLARGQTLGPTTDQDRFAYRTNVTAGKFPFKRTYKVEFGDFPGDDSQAYLDNYGPWLHTTPFFKWVSEADALVFVVDIGMFTRAEAIHDEYAPSVADVSAGIRAAWQQYADTIEGGVRAARYRPLVLAFTKTDMIDVLLPAMGIQGRSPASERFHAGVPYEDIALAIHNLGFGENLRYTTNIDPGDLALAQGVIENYFGDLISYLKGETRRFQIVYTSCTGLMDGKRLGLAKLLKAVLPR